MSANTAHKNCDPTWEVYILQTEDGRLYTGITTDVARRFSEHKDSAKGAKFFQISAPLAVVYRESHPTRSEALRREAAIKKLRRDAKLKLIRSQP